MLTSCVTHSKAAVHSDEFTSPLQDACIQWMNVVTVKCKLHMEEELQSEQKGKSVT